MKTTKEVTVLCRYAHKTDGKLNGTVSYLVRSSDGKTEYCTTLIDGKASGCSCPAHKPCYHMKGLEAKEAGRPFAAKSLPVWAVEMVQAGTLVAPKVAKADESTTIQPIEATDIATTGNLNAAPKNWTSILPSRNKAKVA